MSEHMTLSTSTPGQWPERAIPKMWVDSLFNKMHLKWGMQFVDKWLGLDMNELKRHWATSLGVLTRDELALGVMRLDARKYPPNLPEFLELCRPYLDPLVAYHEASEQGMRRERGEADVWSTPAIFWAWMKIGRATFARVPYEALRARWERVLAAELAKDAHEPIPPFRKALPAPGQATLSVERARQLLADFKHHTRQQSTHVSGDPKRWARLLLDRRDRGEMLEIIQIKDAELALGRP